MPPYCLHAGYLGLFLLFRPMIAFRPSVSRVTGGQKLFKTVMMSTMPSTTGGFPGIIHDSRMTHYDFFRNRKWQMVEQYWSDIIRDSTTLPPFIEGDEKFGVTDLKALERAGMRGEFQSKDLRYSDRRTFAARIGYVGTLYNGYQIQKNVPGVYTVEDDLKKVLGTAAYGAGRTDADVSAVSQVINIRGKGEETAADTLLKMQLSDAVLSGRLAVYDCVRVPKQFNSRSSATWRRYLYLLPLNEGSLNGFDIDIDFVNEALNRLENLELPYNGFAHKEDRTLGEGLKDYCTLYRAKAYKIDITSDEMVPGSAPFTKTTLRENQIKNRRNNDDPVEDIMEDKEEDDITDHENSENWGNSENGDNNSVDSDDIIPNSDDTDASSPVISYTPTKSAMCVELVGSRFLRKMVRILVATVARESTLPKDVRNVNILLDVCNTRDRLKAAASVPGGALCFAGVGYDSYHLALYKFMPKKEEAMITAQNIELLKGVIAHIPHPESAPPKEKENSLVTRVDLKLTEISVNII